MRMAELHADAEQIARIGHNKPPGPLEAGYDTMRALSDWMGECPAIENEDQAREAKKLLDRAKGSQAEIESERVERVSPLNDEIDAINAHYKAVHNKDAKKPGALDRVANELKARLATYIAAEEARREAEAEASRIEAERAAHEAHAAMAREREAIENARAGELGVDVTQVVVEADKRVSEAKKAERAAARAERDASVKVGGGWGKSVSLRTAETLVLVSYGKAITAIGPNDKIRDAILSAARDYRREHGRLPDGVEAETTRKL